ncbi:MerR family transcriptional regulator [Nocardia mexicana]|uniref:DNA-binding transcriptional MerR regulator n=1 Tax=Nocardia mexicana TaxID=279262 RepID=A0A370H251_9NOCA|nr:MerR family transcriptional regulator [Nocardia mexicana]RDI49754.1 DNA-binding transcriptional MerR regulator [Nocardia mexicana]
MRRTALGIGELAEVTGVPVRTIRYYSDEGILESVRSSGGHRRYAPAAVDRLALVRRLRGLGLGLPAIASVLEGERSIAEAVAAERTAVDDQLTVLAWRRARLAAVEGTVAGDISGCVELLAAVEDPIAARDAVIAFWRRLFDGRLPADLFDSFVEMCVPAPPREPTVEQAVAYAELVGLIGNRSLTGRLVTRMHLGHRPTGADTALLAGVGEACQLAEPLVRAGARPGPGAVLDHFVASHAAARKVGDTPEFRRFLLDYLAAERDPGTLRYWQLVGELTDAPVTLGTLQLWLLDGLARSVDAEAHTLPGARAAGLGEPSLPSPV